MDGIKDQLHDGLLKERGAADGADLISAKEHAEDGEKGADHGLNRTGADHRIAVAI